MASNSDSVSVNQIFQDPESGNELDKLFESMNGGFNDTPTPEKSSVPDEKSFADLGEESEKIFTPATPTPEPSPTDPDPIPSEESRVPSFDEETPAVAVEVPVNDDPIAALIKKYDLPASASQKSKDTFANLKALSEEALRLANQKSVSIRAEYEAKIAAAASAAPKTAPTPEDEAELKTLREFRATFDIENDPTFQKSFSKKQEDNYNSIYTIFTQTGLQESELKALKNLPEADRIEQIGEFMDKLPTALKTKVQTKLMANMNLDDERQTALQAAVEKARVVRQETIEAPAKQKELSAAAIKQAAESFQTAPVFKRVEIKADTPPEEKKRLEAVNQNVERYSKLFNDVLHDESPKAKAESAYGVVLAHHFKAQADGLTAQLKKANDELSEIKKRSGVSDKGRVVNVPTSRSGQRPSIDMDSGSVLDQMAREAGFEV